ncbi:MAG: SpoVA/SpoVAEb family sporulation membrane protein [Clostridia bacterium]|nr:SpoVA/SpoVAEb family sporulation membrane protein [Clostridia bacterium]
MNYVMAFLVGGLICVIGQILIIRTKITSARILVIFLLVGVILGILNLYEPIQEFCGAGIAIPIIGFGGTLANGVMKAISEMGFLGVLAGGLTSTAIGVSAAVFFSFIVALIFKSKTKHS